MIDPRGIMAVFKFECARTVTAARLVGWTILAVFPPILLTAISTINAQIPNERNRAPDEVWWMFFFILLPEVICLLGLLLWATPMIHAEIEGRTWIYLAVRRRGKGSVLFGKYLTAICWTGSAALVGLSASVVLAQPPEALRVWGVYSVLICLSCLAYGSVYTLFGVVFQRRAMVVAVLYTLLLEFVVSFVPAVVNKITIHYRLRGLMVEWMEFPVPPVPTGEVIFGTESPTHNVLVLVCTSVVLLAASFAILHAREVASATEN